MTARLVCVLFVVSSCVLVSGLSETTADKAEPMSGVNGQTPLEHLRGEGAMWVLFALPQAGKRMVSQGQ